MRPILFCISLLFCLACGNTENLNEQHNQTSELYEKSNDLSDEKKADVLYELIRKINPNDTIETYALYSLCGVHFRMKNYDSLFYYGQRIRSRAIDKPGLLNLGKYYHLMGHYHEKINSNYDSAFYYHDMSRKAFLKAKDSSRVFRRIVRLAFLQRFQGDYFGAKETLTEALSYNKGSNDNYMANLFNELGIVHMELQNYAEAKEYYEKAIATTQSDKDRTVYQNNLGVSLIESGNHTIAENLFSNIISENTLDEEPEQLAKAIQNLGHSKWKSGNKNVLDDYLRAFEISTKAGDLNGLIFGHIRLGEFYTPTFPQKARKHLDSSIALTKKIKRPRLEIDALKRLMILDPKAHKYKDRYIVLRDSLYDQELQVKTQFAKMKYDDEQEKARLLSLEAEAAQKKAELAKEETQKILFLSLSAIFLMAGVSLYFLLKQRHKKEKLKEVYNTEKRISQDLHDGMANDVFGLMTQIQNKDKVDKELLSNLEVIYQTTREISHQNAAIRTGTAFRDELDGLINSYQHNGSTIITKGINSIDWPKLDDIACIVVHRTLKELLVNMKKHSQASLVSLQFENQKNKLVISYSDNGVGFDSKKNHGIGLKNTENRIRSLGGQFIFEPKQGSGTKAVISIPN